MKLPIWFTVLTISTLAILGGFGIQALRTSSAPQKLAAGKTCDAINSVFQQQLTLSVTNSTPSPYRLVSTEVDCYDFSGENNPSTLDGVVIQPGETVTRSFDARRVCDWIAGSDVPDEIFTTRDANWTFGIAKIDGTAQATTRLQISCTDVARAPVMCQQDLNKIDSARLEFPRQGNRIGGAVSLDMSCDYDFSTSSNTITLTKLY